MRYLTATEAAKRIGVAEKTVRLWVKEGKLEAHHAAKNRLAIPEDMVDLLADERRLYYPQPDMPSSSSTQPDISALETRVRELEQKVASLEQTIHTLTHPVTSSQASEKPEKLYNYAVDKSDVQPQQSTQKRATIASSTTPGDLPIGTLSAYDFADILDIDREHMKNYMRRGVDGEMLEITDVPHHSRVGYTLKFLTPPQQEQAIALLKRHGKIK